MNASALNSAAIPAPGQSAPNAASGAGAANNPLAGFEALLGALFPTGNTANAGAAAVNTAGGAGKDASVSANKAAGKNAGKPADESQDADALATDPTDAAAADATGLDANADLLASLLGAPTAVADADPDTVKTGPAEQAPAWARDKSKGVTAAPTMNNAASQAALEDDGVMAGPSSPDAADFADAIPARESPRAGKSASSLSATLTPPTASAASSASVPAAAAAQATPANQAARAPEIQAAASADAAPEPVAADGQAAPTPPPAAASLLARPEPAPSPARDAKAERTKGEGAAKVASHMRPTEAVDLPVHGKIAEAAPKSTAAPAEALEPRAHEAGETDVSAETPETGPQGETRASAQTSAPTTTAHAVRGTPETVATLAAQIVQKLAGKSTRFDLELNPGGLGKVDVRVEIGANGHITAAMTFDNPQAAADLRARSSELQRALEQAGFEMAGGLSFDVAGEQGQQQQQQTWRDQNDNSGSAFRGQAFRAALDTAGDAADAAVQGALRLRRGVSAGLDLRI